MKKQGVSVFIIFVLVLLSLSVVVFCRNNVTAFADNIDVFSYEDSNVNLNSDIIDSNNTIRNYPINLHATKACIRSSERMSPKFILNNANEDDPIVYIVPKKHFFAVGDVLEIGDEYGYFISTNRTERGNYCSTVLVFDISTNTNLIETIDRVIVEIKPIFQYKYMGLTLSTTVEDFNGFLVNYTSLDNPCVVAYPSSMGTTVSGSEVQYEMIEDYYIKDVSFGASLFNEQNLNRGDFGYNPYSDYGSYFTSFDYSYNGKYREYGEFNGEDLAWNIADTVRFGLGFLDAIPILGTVTSLLGQIYDVSTLGKSWGDFVVDNYNVSNGQIQVLSKQLTTTCFYQNRDDQLNHYKDSNI